MSAGQLPDALPHVLVAWMRVDRGIQWAHVPREPLRHEEVLRCRLDILLARVEATITTSVQALPFDAVRELAIGIYFSQAFPIHAVLQVESRAFGFEHVLPSVTERAYATVVEVKAKSERCVPGGPKYLCLGRF